MKRGPKRITVQPAASAVGSRKQWPWAVRNGFFIVVLVPVATQLLGSLFNIGYNLRHVLPLLTEEQYGRFQAAILYYNLAIYPLAIAVVTWMFVALRGPMKSLIAGEPVAFGPLWRARRLAVNLPWWGTAVGLFAWAGCVPVFLTVLHLSAEPLDWRVNVHLPISLAIAALISLSMAFAAFELLSQRLIFPVLFQDAQPLSTPGAWPLSLTGRGILLAVVAGVCPVLALLLLFYAPATDPGLPGHDPIFATSVAAVAISFGMTAAAMLGRLVAEPIRQLREATRQVASGDLSVQVPALRADEFGPLISQFNQMVVEMREKRQLRETFGAYVGEVAARQILSRDPGLGGQTQNVTVMFADLRNFTQRSETGNPAETVEALNLFLDAMVDVVENEHGGMVNKFLGDGFMALFGIESPESDHADRAVAAAAEMVHRLQQLNDQLARRELPPLVMGVGIHTGPALVGSIGSPGRREYTAIGDTINTAARVEALTKTVGTAVLFTAAVREELTSVPELVTFPPRSVKGKQQPLTVFGLASGTCLEKGTDPLRE